MLTQPLQSDFGHWSTNRRWMNISNMSLFSSDSVSINIALWYDTRSSKPLRSEIQLLSQLCWDDTPEMDINSVRFPRAWLNRISTVLRNAYAYALCNMCQMPKLAEFTFPHLNSESGLRHVMAIEFIAADKKIWRAIPQLHAKGWTREESIHEMTVVRSDISSLLKPRPNVPKPLPQPRENKGKCKGKGTQKDPAKEKQNAPNLQKKSRIGALGASTTTSLLLCAWNSTQVNTKEPIAIIIMVAPIVFKMDDPACKTMQQRIIEEDPPDFLLLHQLTSSTSTSHTASTTTPNIKINPTLEQNPINHPQTTQPIKGQCASVNTCNVLASHSTQESGPKTQPSVRTKLSPDVLNSSGEPSSPQFVPPLQPNQPRICLD